MGMLCPKLLHLIPELFVLRLQRADVGNAAEEGAEWMEHLRHRSLKGAHHGLRGSAGDLEGAAMATSVVDGDRDEARDDECDHEEPGAAGALDQRHGLSA